MINTFHFARFSKLVAGIELGGQTAAIALSDKLGSLIWKEKGIKTSPPTDPKESLKNLSQHLSSQNKSIDAIGIAAFGPLDVKNGKVLTTPKPNWRNFPLIQEVKKIFPKVPIVLDTDVNAPAFSEFLAFNDPKIQSVAYITIGTGIGLGLFSDNKCYHGSMHPEAGHLVPKRIPGDLFEGNCPYHGDCVEGLISALALGKRNQVPPSEVKNFPNDDPIWKIFVGYTSEMIATCHLAYSLDAIVIGGGIVTAKGREFLIRDIEKEVKTLLKGYVREPIICLPHFGTDAGLVGACALALYKDQFQNF